MTIGGITDVSYTPIGWSAEQKCLQTEEPRVKKVEGEMKSVGKGTGVRPKIVLNIKIMEIILFKVYD